MSMVYACQSLWIACSEHGDFLGEGREESWPFCTELYDQLLNETEQRTALSLSWLELQSNFQISSRHEAGSTLCDGQLQSVVRLDFLNAPPSPK